MNMLIQLKFILYEMKNKKLYYFKISIQFIIALLVIGFSINELINLYEFNFRFKEIFENPSQFCFIRDNTSDEKINRIIEENNKNKLFELYNYLHNANDFTIYSYDDNFYLDIESDDTHIIKASDESENDSTYLAISTDQDFFDIFKLNISQGRSFTKDEYKTESKLTPVVLGNYYKDFYKPNDIIENKYKVVGILDENSFYIDPHKTKDILYLNKKVLVPTIVNEKIDLTTLDTIITNSVIWTNNLDSLKNITTKLKNMNLYDFEFDNYSNQFKYILKDYTKQILFSASIALLILLFCTICIISSLINYIETHKKEFAIHIFSGANKSDFVIRTIIQISIPIFLALIIITFVYKLSIVTLFIFIFSILIILIASSFPLITIRKISISELLRRSE